MQAGRFVSQDMLPCEQAYCTCVHMFQVHVIGFSIMPAFNIHAMKTDMVAVCYHAMQLLMSAHCLRREVELLVPYAPPVLPSEVHGPARSSW